MSDSPDPILSAPRTPPLDTARAHPGFWSWEAYSVVVATIVGLLSLSVSAYTAYTLRVQTRAQVFPYLQVETSPSERRLGIRNKGVGPAFVKSVEVAVDGRPVPDWPSFFRATGMSLHGQSLSSTINHTAIAANEIINVLAFQDPADFVSFASVDPRRYRYRICYCSVLDECWSITSDDRPSTGPMPDAVCRNDPVAEFTQ